MSSVIRRCVSCGCDEFEIGHVSRRGLCEDCGAAKAVQVAVEMHDKRGPSWAAFVGRMRHWVDELDGREGG